MLRRGNGAGIYDSCIYVSVSRRFSFGHIVAIPSFPSMRFFILLLCFNLIRAQKFSSTYSLRSTVYSNVCVDSSTATISLGSHSVTLPQLLSSVATAGQDPCALSISSFDAEASSFRESISLGIENGAYHTITTVVTDIVTMTIPSYSLSAFGPTYGTLQMSYAWWTTMFTDTSTLFTATETILNTPTLNISYPSCIPTQVASHSYSGACGPCTLFANSVKLIYWPVSTASGTPNLTITPTGTSILTGVSDGTTYTSGSVYLKYEMAGASNFCGGVGKNHLGAVITLRSDEVSSLVGDGTYFGGAESFNYADLNYPVPWSVVGTFPDQPSWCSPGPSFETISEEFGAFGDGHSILLPRFQGKTC